jgi:hypothetical protein
MAVTLPTDVSGLSPEEQQAAESIAYALYTGQRDSSKLNEAGRGLLTRYQQHLQSQGYSSFKDYLAAQGGELTTPSSPGAYEGVREGKTGPTLEVPIPGSRIAQEGVMPSAAPKPTLGGAVAKGLEGTASAVSTGLQSLYTLPYDIGNALIHPLDVKAVLGAGKSILGVLGGVFAPVQGLSEALNYARFGSERVENIIASKMGFPNYDTLLTTFGVPAESAKVISTVLRGAADPANLVFAGQFVSSLTRLGRLGATKVLDKIAADAAAGRPLDKLAETAQVEITRLTAPAEARASLEAKPVRAPAKPREIPEGATRADLTRPALPAPKKGFTVTPGSYTGRGERVPGVAIATERYDRATRRFKELLDEQHPNYNPDKPWLIEELGPRTEIQMRAAEQIGLEPPLDPGPAPVVDHVGSPETAAKAFEPALKKAEARAAEAEVNLVNRTKIAAKAVSRRFVKSNLPKSVEHYAAGGTSIPPSSEELATTLDAQQASKQALETEADFMRLQGQQARQVHTPEPLGYSVDEWGVPEIAGGSDSPIRLKRRDAFSQPDEIVANILRIPVTGSPVQKYVVDRYSIESQYLQELRKNGVYQKSLLHPGGMTPAEFTNLRRVVEGTEAPMNDRVRVGAIAVKQIGDKYGKELEDLGATIMARRLVTTAKIHKTVELTGPDGKIYKKGAWVDDPHGARQVVPEIVPFERIPNRFPIRVSRDRIIALGESKLFALLRKANPMVDDAELKEIAAALHARAIGEMPTNASAKAWEVIQRSTWNTMLHERTGITLPEEIRHDPFHELVIDARDHANTLAAARHFGPADEYWTNMKQKVGNVADRQALEWVYRRIRGLDHRGPDEVAAHGWARIGNSMAAFLLISMKTTLKHFNRYAAGLGKLGVGNMLNGFVKAFSVNGRMDAEAAGMFARNIQDAWVNIYKTGSIEKATRGAIRATGVPQMDAFARVVTYHAAKSEISSLRAAAAMGNRRAAIRLFNKYGVDAVSATAEDIDRAAASMATRLSPTPGAATEFQLLQSPQMKFARSLNVFTATYSKLIHREFIAPLVESRFQSLEAWGDLLRFAGASYASGEILGAAFDEVNHLIFGINASAMPGGSFPEFADDFMNGRVTPMQLALRLVDAIAVSHGIGILSNTAMVMIRNGNALSWSNLPGVLGREGLNLVTGATWSNWMEMARGLTAAIKRVVPGQKGAKPTSLKDLTRRVPIVGGLFTKPSDNTLRGIYVTAYIRALRRHDPNAGRFLEEYHQQTGKFLTDKTIETTRKEMGL